MPRVSQIKQQQQEKRKVEELKKQAEQKEIEKNNELKTEIELTEVEPDEQKNINEAEEKNNETDNKIDNEKQESNQNLPQNDSVKVKVKVKVIATPQGGKINCVTENLILDVNDKFEIEETNIKFLEYIKLNPKYFKIL